MANRLRNMARVLKMPCREHGLLMSRDLDEPLDVEIRLALRVHAVVCRPCRRLWQHLRFLRQAAQRWRGDQGPRPVPIGMPDDVRRRLRERIRAF